MAERGTRRRTVVGQLIVDAEILRPRPVADNVHRPFSRNHQRACHCSPHKQTTLLTWSVGDNPSRGSTYPPKIRNCRSILPKILLDSLRELR